MHFCFMIVVNKTANQNIYFGLNLIFQGSYNRKNARIDKSLLPIKQLRQLDKFFKTSFIQLDIFEY